MNDSERKEIKRIGELLRDDYISDFASNKGVSIPYSEELGMYHHRLELFGIIPEVPATEEFISVIPDSIYTVLRDMIGDIIESTFTEEKDIIIYQYIYKHYQFKKLFEKKEIVEETYEIMNFPEDSIFERKFLVGTAHVKIRNISLLKRIGILSATSVHGPDIYNDMMLYNYHRGILLHIYDDRGCDVFFKKKSDADDFYKKFKTNIDYYNDWPNRLK